MLKIRGYPPFPSCAAAKKKGFSVEPCDPAARLLPEAIIEKQILMFCDGGEGYL